MIKLFKMLLLCFCLTFSLQASRIVSVGGSISETVIGLGHANELIGVDISSIYPKEITSKLPSVGYWLSLPKEGILSLKPDTVILSSLSKPKSVVNSLPDFGIKTYIIDDKPTIDSAKKKIKQIGEILGESKKANEIVSRIEKNVLKLKEEIKGKKKPKVLFIFSRGKGAMLAAGAKTKPGVMIELAGGVNALEFPQYTKISSESILKMNPDIIITSKHKGDSGLDKEVIASTNAGKNKQIYNMGILLISGFTLRVDEALQDLSCMFNSNNLSYCK